MSHETSCVNVRFTFSVLFLLLSNFATKKCDIKSNFVMNNFKMKTVALLNLEYPTQVFQSYAKIFRKYSHNKAL